MAQVQYERGQYSVSATALERAVETYRAEGKSDREAMTLSLLSLVYEKLGQWQKAKKAIDDSLSQGMRVKNDLLRAKILNRQGRWQLATGQLTAAERTAHQAELLYARAEDLTGVIGAKINQAQALKMRGFYRNARKIQRELSQKIESLPDTEIKVMALHTIGNLWRQEGELISSEASLSRAGKLAEKKHLPLTAKISVSLGNTERALANANPDWAKQHTERALNYYQRAVEITTDPLVRIQAQLNQLGFLIEVDRFDAAIALLKPIESELQSLPGGRSAILARISLAQNVLLLQGRLFDRKVERYLVNNLDLAIIQAREIADRYAESYGLGTLGKYYEQRGDTDTAQQLTQSALTLAQGLNIPELTYQWQWQLGRITQTRDRPLAIAYYDLALNTLQTLRQELMASSSLKFTFQSSIEPLYREYLDLLLTSPQLKGNLAQSIDVLEQLQVAELDNLFRDACAREKVRNVSNLDPQAAIIYPIILPERLEVILQLPGKQLYHHTQLTSELEVNTAIERLQRSLVQRSISPKQLKQESSQLYDWLIKPFAAELETKQPRSQSQIKTLVFVLDGALRNVPMSVLHDGQKYLLERYAVAVSPGIRLTDILQSSRKNLRVLLAGANNAPSFRARQLAPLIDVPQELTGIAQIVKRTAKLEDKEFQQSKLQEKLEEDRFNIVHLATHGQFGSSSEDTYILDWKESIGLKDLDRLLEAEDPRKLKPIDLLVLSACETAIGDRQAALGLAGVAVRSGASSTVASLWQVNDASTSHFMIEFYRQLSNTQLTKAEALRKTQLSFLTTEDNTDYDRPYHWGAFILVGDWR